MTPRGCRGFERQLDVSSSCSQSYSSTVVAECIRVSARSVMTEESGQAGEQCQRRKCRLGRNARSKRRRRHPYSDVTGRNVYRGRPDGKFRNGRPVTCPRAKSITVRINDPFTTSQLDLREAITMSASPTASQIAQIASQLHLALRLVVTSAPKSLRSGSIRRSASRPVLAP